MNYAILKLDNIIIVIAEYGKKRFEIVLESGNLEIINVYKYLSFNRIVNSWKENGYKQIKKFTVRQYNEKNI